MAPPRVLPARRRTSFTDGGRDTGPASAGRSADLPTEAPTRGQARIERVNYRSSSQQSRLAEVIYSNYCPNKRGDFQTRGVCEGGGARWCPSLIFTRLRAIPRGTAPRIRRIWWRGPP